MTIPMILFPPSIYKIFLFELLGILERKLQDYKITKETNSLISMFYLVKICLHDEPCFIFGEQFVSLVMPFHKKNIINYIYQST